METRIVGIIVALGIGISLVFGALVGGLFAKQNISAGTSAVQLAAPEQDDYIIMVAESYAADHDLKLAQDRLARLHDPLIAARVEKLATVYSSQRDLIAQHLAQLAAALGSQNSLLLAMLQTAMPQPTGAPTAMPTVAPTSTTAPPPVNIIQIIIVNTPTEMPTRISTNTATPLLPTLVRTATPYATTATLLLPSVTLRPLTKIPTVRAANTLLAAPTATSTTAPAPLVNFEPSFPDQWWGSTYFVPANVAPGQAYWHLTKALYCDFTENNFGCPDAPGGQAGTSIYVMDAGTPIDVIKPDGTNVGGDSTVIGEKKAASDMCQCNYTFLVSDYKISVAGAPSDALGGFCLCTVHGNVLQGHAHVRYFLYFQYITR